MSATTADPVLEIQDVGANRAGEYLHDVRVSTIQGVARANVPSEVDLHRSVTEVGDGRAS
jgi:hypothetical protein